MDIDVRSSFVTYKTNYYTQINKSSYILFLRRDNSAAEADFSKNLPSLKIIASSRLICTLPQNYAPALLQCKTAGGCVASTSNIGETLRLDLTGHSSELWLSGH